MNIWNYNKGKLLKYKLPEKFTKLTGKIYDHLWYDKFHLGFIQSFIIENQAVIIIDEIDVQFKVKNSKIKKNILTLEWNRDYKKENTRLVIEGENQ